MITRIQFEALEARYPNLTEREFAQHGAFADRQDAANRKREIRAESKRQDALYRAAQRQYDRP